MKLSPALSKILTLALNSQLQLTDLNSDSYSTDACIHFLWPFMLVPAHSPFIYFHVSLYTIFFKRHLHFFRPLIRIDISSIRCRYSSLVIRFTHLSLRITRPNTSDSLHVNSNIPSREISESWKNAYEEFLRSSDFMHKILNVRIMWHVNCIMINMNNSSFFVQMLYIYLRCFWQIWIIFHQLRVSMNHRFSLQLCISLYIFHLNFSKNNFFHCITSN